jgi:hypothetical protein
MIEISTYTPDGAIQQRMVLVDEAEADMNGLWVPGHWDERDYYVSSGAVVTPRPELNISEVLNAVVGDDLFIGVLPEGSEIFIDGILVGATDDTPLSLSFPVVRIYKVECKPSFPYKPAAFQVNVHEA